MVYSLKRQLLDWESRKHELDAKLTTMEEQGTHSELFPGLPNWQELFEQTVGRFVQILRAACCVAGSPGDLYDIPGVVDAYFASKEATSDVASAATMAHWCLTQAPNFVATKEDIAFLARILANFAEDAGLLVSGSSESLIRRPS